MITAPTTDIESDILTAAAGEPVDVIQEAINEVCRIAGLIDAYRESEDLARVAFVTKYKALGSEDSLSRLARKTNLENFRRNARDWLRRYQGVWDEIQMHAAGKGKVEEHFDDLSGPAATVDAFVELLEQPHTDQCRMILVQGTTGTGKTKCLEAVQRTMGNAVVLVTGDPSWQTLMGVIRSLYIGLGICTEESWGTERPRKNIDGMARIYATLGDSRKILLFDECQEMTGEGAKQGLNFIKALLNKTRCIIGIAAVSSLWTKIQASVWEEAMQIALKRTWETITLTGPTLEDCRLYMLRKAGLSLQPADCVELRTKAAGKGDYQFLNRVVTELRKTGGTDAKALSRAVAAVAERIDRQIPRRKSL